MAVPPGNLFLFGIRSAPLPLWPCCSYQSEADMPGTFSEEGIRTTGEQCRHCAPVPLFAAQLILRQDFIGTGTGAQSRIAPLCVSILPCRGPGGPAEDVPPFQLGKGVP